MRAANRLGQVSRALALLVVGFVLGACCTPPLSAPVNPTRTEQAQDLESKTVALVVPNDAGRPRAFCSGVWVGDQSFLTAHHCVAGDSTEFGYVVRSDVYAPGEYAEREFILPRRAVLWATDDAHDLALLRTPDRAPAHHVARIAQEPVHAGQHVMAMGHSLGLWWSFSSGDVAALRQKDFGGDMDILWVQTTTPTSPGNSGCGLFDESGNLVGLAHGGMTRGQNLNLYVHPRYVSEFLAGKAL